MQAVELDPPLGTCGCTVLPMVLIIAMGLNSHYRSALPILYKDGEDWLCRTGCAWLSIVLLLLYVYDMHDAHKSFPGVLGSSRNGWHYRNQADTCAQLPIFLPRICIIWEIEFIYVFKIRI